MSHAFGDVLIVDDVFSSRELLGGVLHRVCDLPYRMARTANEALNAVGDRPPAIIFLDIDLPDLSGLDVLKCVQASGMRSYVVMVSGFGTPNNVKIARESGASAFILKPYQPNKVVEVLQAFERKTHLQALRH